MNISEMQHDIVHANQDYKKRHYKPRSLPHMRTYLSELCSANG